MLPTASRNVVEYIGHGYGGDADSAAAEGDGKCGDSLYLVEVNQQSAVGRHEPADRGSKHQERPIWR